LPAGGSAEICDGKDNDCDGVNDNGASSTLCPPPTHTTATSCTTGKCKTTICTTGFVDVDGSYSNGCECTDLLSPTSCTSASDVGTVGVGSSKVYTSNIPTLGSSNFVKVTFLNTKTDKLAHPKIQFTTNPGTALQFEILYGGCGGTTPMCATGPDTATAKTIWETSYTSAATGNWDDGNGGLPPTFNWVPISNGAYVPASSPHATVYVRIFYKAGVTAATCDTYTLNFAN
jgi:hypothetical protein